MRGAWRWLLEHAHAVRVSLLVVLIVGGTIWGWYLWKNGGYTENAPPRPQFVELYVDGSPQSATASVVSVVTPVTAFGRGGKACAIETAGCDDATEYVTVTITPQPSEMASWLLVTDTRPADPQPWKRAQVPPSKGQFAGFPVGGAWIHHGLVAGNLPVTFKTQFDIHVVARPSDHLIIEMPGLMNEANPQSWCGPEAELDLSSTVPHVIPQTLGPDCSLAPGQSGFPIASVLPFTGPTNYFAPQTVTTTEVLSDPSDLRGFTLDSSSSATPIASGFDWTGTYQVEPAIYATNISGSGLVARRQLLLGVLIGLALAALLGLVQEFRNEKKHPTREGREAAVE